MLMWIKIDFIQYNTNNETVYIKKEWNPAVPNSKIITQVHMTSAIANMTRPPLTLEVSFYTLEETNKGCNYSMCHNFTYFSKTV